MDLEALKTEGERLAEKLKDCTDPEERKAILDEIRRINDMINEQVRLDHDQQRIDLEEGKIDINNENNKKFQAKVKQSKRKAAEMGTWRTREKLKPTISIVELMQVRPQ